MFADADIERLKLALAAARLGDWTWDATSDVVTMSPRAAQIFEIPPGPHMTWTAMRELIHPDDRARAQTAVTEAVAQHTDCIIEYRLINGYRERWVSVSGRARYDDSDRVVGMVGVVQDRSRTRLLTLIDESLRPLLEPREISQTAARLVGDYLRVSRCLYATVEEDQDTFVLEGDYTSGADSIAGRQAFREFGSGCLTLLRAGQPYVVTDTANDPRIRPADAPAYERDAVRAMICVPILKGGRLIAAMTVHSAVPREWDSDDVELVQHGASRCWEAIERARIERDRASLLEAAQAANRAKDEFMAMLGHELRNPLSPIFTALQLMKMRGDTHLARERQVIERQVTHLTRLVDDLLDVSRIARGKVDLKTEIVELADVVASAIEMASPLLEERLHSLETDVPAVGLPVSADVTRLSQVVSNLLTNAAKYTPSGGRIKVRARLDGEQAVLSVIDSGIGIAPTALRNVFDLFVQGRQESDRASGGLGLGLTIVRSLVERHGGSVAAHSDGPGLGSEFIVRLPLAAGAAARMLPGERTATAAAARKPAPAFRVLIVDDNEDGAEMLRSALRAYGHEIAVALDGPAALRLCQTFVPDVALLDLGLPVMDGYELAGRLCQMPGLERMQLMAVSGYGQPSDLDRTRQSGFRAHLVKPVNVAEVQASILALCTEPAVSRES